MARYLLNRLISLLLSLAVASVAIFAVIELVPGDPASFMLGINASGSTQTPVEASRTGTKGWQNNRKLSFGRPK